MPHALTRHRRTAAAPRARGGLAPWLMVIVFLLQLLLAAEHHHELHAKTPHCVSCAIHAQPHAAPPDTTLAPAAAGWPLVRALASRPAPQVTPAPAQFLLPPSHGPPAFPST